MTLHADLLVIAEAQHGVIGLDQLRDREASRANVQALRESVEWRHGPGRVLYRRGSPATRAQALMAAVLDIGADAFLSHSSAAEWWGMPGFTERTHPRVQVSRRRGNSRRRSPLAVTHVARDVGDNHVVTRDSIPVSSPARTIFELAATEHEGHVERACDTAVAMRLTSLPALHRMLEEWADRGRNGTVVMRTLLDDRPAGSQPVASNLESRFRKLSERWLLGPFRRQVDLGDDQLWVGRVDFRHRDLPLVVEVQSARFHSVRLDVEADRVRIAALEASGFTVVQVWDDELWYAPDAPMERVWAALHALRRAAA